MTGSLVVKMIRTNVVCPRCREPLCNLCRFNGHCEECGAPISRATGRKLRAAVKKTGARS